MRMMSTMRRAMSERTKKTSQVVERPVMELRLVRPKAKSSYTVEILEAI